MKQFNVIVWDVNHKHTEVYDVIPYFVRTYNELKERYKENEKSKRKNKPIITLPKTFDEFKEFVTTEGKYMYWSRCQYEIIIHDWPWVEGKEHREKWDVWGQIEMNLDLVTQIVMEECEPSFEKLISNQL